MQVDFYKYQGTGNDFIIIDNRNGNFDTKSTSLVSFLCHRRMGIGADGLMLLESNDSEKVDFTMRYYNSDGKEASMCGNGGRCIAAFAVRIGAVTNADEFYFEAADGMHVAKFKNDIVSLKMIDVSHIDSGEGYYFLNTGVPHYVTHRNNIADIDIVNNGSKIRYSATFKPDGTNVNFVEQQSHNQIKVRTYERGVENETYSCGTGVVASAIATFVKNKQEKFFDVDVKGGRLQVHFEGDEKSGFSNIWLIGPATLVFEGKVELER
ncbi:diaminopimelate epimerase [Saccharicrinis carchari]|uniref:Diaminopimelate epimerase n=1 Tax=Saccharicrinis carchari TaxID=1168039 RepID=A0A521B832_SACCC|nr:diaminopimelate epimerase [Saccharicrinis carchari]SMO43257.1 diaminopimelate epimerase [Saccharicrinis carchari]